MTTDELELVPDGELRLGVDRHGRLAASRYVAHPASEVFEPTGRSRGRRGGAAVVSQDHVELDG